MRCRGLLAAVIIAWTLFALCGGMAMGEYCELVARTLIVGTFTVTAGVWFSLTSANATMSMTLTLVSWLVGALVAMIIAAIAVGCIFIAGAIWVAYMPPSIWGQVAPSGNTITMWLAIGYAVAQLIAYAIATFLIAGYCAANFDRLAGRLAPEWFRAIPVRRAVAVEAIPVS